MSRVPRRRAGKRPWIALRDLDTLDVEDWMDARGTMNMVPGGCVVLDVG